MVVAWYFGWLRTSFRCLAESGLKPTSQFLCNMAFGTRHAATELDGDIGSAYSMSLVSGGLELGLGGDALAIRLF